MNLTNPELLLLSH